MSDTRLAARWAALRRARRTALIPYITAGFPDAEQTAAFLRGAAVAGADIVELGIPWSDPVADGPVIQASSHDALRAGASVQRALDTLRSARPEIPVVIFSYLNPLLAYGPSRFAAAAAAAGAAALLVIDLPVGADPSVEADLRAGGLPLVRLVAPTTGAERLVAIARASEGFVYLVARTGVTGHGGGESAALADRVAAVRAQTDLPVAVGFGIAGPAQAAAVARVADGVVVGSAVVERLREGGAAGALHWLGGLRDAMDRAGAAA